MIGVRSAELRGGEQCAALPLCKAVPLGAATRAAHEKLFAFDKGTTTLAFKYRGGVMVACDSRASQGTFVASQTVRKIIEINEYLLGTMAGCAADCSFWERHVARLCRQHELQHKQRVRVSMAAKWLADCFFHYRGYGLSCGTMIAGYDFEEADSKLFYVDDSGWKCERQVASVGSGQGYAYSVLDNGYRFDLSDAEALQLAKRAIFQATVRDGASGGVVRVYRVAQGGWQKLVEAADVAVLQREFGVSG
uniref:Proteasome subunit beta n=1 Tax=Dermatophagoides pteronyssinus TaxID=6956 RepID=A0A6P6YJK9_DERPT|nr:proteasome subunit beta type-5-like [Dermatophagoides pteronyssinus]